MGLKLDVLQEGHVLVLRLNDPQTRNALNGDDFYAALEQTVARANADLTVRAVVLTGEGSAFSSGGNVQDMKNRTGMFGGTAQQIAEQYRVGIQRIPRALWALDVPSIAAVNGPAIGAGCDLTCLCDIRIASRKAIFAESFVRVGIVAGDGGSWLLPRVVGYSKAAELAFTGEAVDADKALQIGLVSQVVEPDELMSAAMDLANRIALNPPHVLRWTKRLMKDAQRDSLDDTLAKAASYQAIAHGTEDHAEAVSALLEKRPGQFKGQ